MINLNKITAVATNATTTNKLTVVSSTQYTLDGARDKVITKLLANIAYINNGMETKSGDKLDLVFKDVVCYGKYNFMGYYIGSITGCN